MFDMMNISFEVHLIAWFAYGQKANFILPYVVDENLFLLRYVTIFMMYMNTLMNEHPEGVNLHDHF